MESLGINLIAIQILIAWVLDLILGDPYWFPHPVRGIGRLIASTERLLRFTRVHERVAGAALACFVVGIVYFAVAQIVDAIAVYGQFADIAAGSVIIYFALSARCLTNEADKITALLEADNILRARKELSYIVGRDTAEMDREEISRACIECLAENMVDGIISPLFYAFIGGAPFAMAYKAVNTLDSMVGYKNEKYLRLGWASARLDDAANFAPARIARAIIAVASFICGFGFYNSIRISIRDGQKHPSPNSGISEAAFAGALQIRLGGPCSYDGKISDKPFIGDQIEALSVDKIKNAARLVRASSFVAIAFGFGALILIGRF